MRAGAVLIARGYRPHLDLSPAQESLLSRSECDRVYLREGRNIVLELHWAVAPPFFSVGIETEAVLADCVRAEMCGSACQGPFVGDAVVDSMRERDERSVDCARASLLGE